MKRGVYGVLDLALLSGNPDEDFSLVPTESRTKQILNTYIRKIYPHTDRKSNRLHPFPQY